MYENFYGFKEKPFSLLPDPEFLYLSAKHSSAFSVLEYGMTGQAGFTVISGEVGSGKTTLVRSFIKQVGPEATVGLISNTPSSFGELLRWILYAFDLDYQGKETVELHEAFVQFLIAQYAIGRRCVLIIDEAQNLDIETLEELRMLSNVNSSKDLLLQVILVGQPELAETLSRPDMQQFAQRISISYHLKALTLEETHAYIRHRLAVAGGDATIFTDDACDALYILSQGVPRLINGLCDISLVYGFGEEMPQVDLETVLAVMEDRTRASQGAGGMSFSREVISKEVARLANTRTSSRAAQPAKAVGDSTSFAVIPDKTGPSSRPRVVRTFTSPLNSSAIGTTSVVSGIAGTAKNGTPPAKLPAGGKEADSPDTEVNAAPTEAKTRPGPREFSPEFSGSRRSPAPESNVAHRKLRWFLAAASLAIFLFGLWLVLASPKIVL
jgi:general secretion pathway protein A